MSEFAPDFERDDNGWIKFPRDTELRKMLFPDTDPTEHIAKANMIMVRELVSHFTERGETILDPFAGTGTIMVACTIGREAMMIELGTHFIDTIESNIQSMKAQVPDIEKMATLIPGNANSILPIPDWVDHLCFSPPYPMGLKKKTMSEVGIEKAYKHAHIYSEEGGQDNFTNLNQFFYHQKIYKFYEKCLETVKPGGTMTVIIKDHIEQGKRQENPERTVRDCLKMGWELLERNKWLAMGGAFTAFNRASGLETVDDEDLITFRKPS